LFFCVTDGALGFPFWCFASKRAPRSCGQILANQPWILFLPVLCDRGRSRDVTLTRGATPARCPKGRTRCACARPRSHCGTSLLETFPTGGKPKTKCASPSTVKPKTKCASLATALPTQKPAAL